MERVGRILVVDDNPRWRDLLSESLQQYGFHVDTAATAEEVLRRLSETFNHLLVLDIRLEDADESNIDGMKLMQPLHQQGLTSANDHGLINDLHVIMLSAFDTKEQKHYA